MLLLIDNYDSFVHNLARYFQRLGQPTRVVRNDAVDVNDVEDMNPSAIVISPGPCTPTEAGCSLEIVRTFCGRIPILGVCLGHQAIAAELGASICRAPVPMHGRTSDIQHDRTGVFEGVPSPLTVCRYHSLIVDPSTLPTCLEVSARSSDGLIMGIRHRQHPVVGLQFHPESILTNSGYDLLAGFLTVAGMRQPHATPNKADELTVPSPRQWRPPEVPVTF